MTCVSLTFVGNFPRNVRVHEDAVEQKRKYEEPKDQLFEEFSEHLFKLKYDFYPRYYTNAKSKYNIKDFNIINFIGNNSTILCKHKKVGKFYAVQVISKNMLITTNRIKETLNEKRIAQAVRFRFLLHLEYTFKDKFNIYFVYPFATDDSLFTLLQREQVLKERDAKFYGCQILMALEYLHNIDIIHRNVKPENIIFMPNGYIKLSDYKFAKLVDLRTYSLCGTPEYMAPEMILNKGYGKWVDWWAFGVLLYEMISGFTPFYSPDSTRIYEKILEGRLKFRKYGFSNECKNLIQNILHRNLSQRYGNLLNKALDIKCHSWFEIIDWQKVYHQTLNPPYVPDNQMPKSKPKKVLNSFQSAGGTEINKYENEFEDF